MQVFLGLLARCGGESRVQVIENADLGLGDLGAVVVLQEDGLALHRLGGDGFQRGGLGFGVAAQAEVGRFAQLLEAVRVVQLHLAAEAYQGWQAVVYRNLPSKKNFFCTLFRWVWISYKSECSCKFIRA